MWWDYQLMARDWQPSSTADFGYAEGIQLLFYENNIELVEDWKQWRRDKSMKREDHCLVAVSFADSAMVCTELLCAE